MKIANLDPVELLVFLCKYSSQLAKDTYYVTHKEKKIRYLKDLKKNIIYVFDSQGSTPTSKFFKGIPLGLKNHIRTITLAALKRDLEEYKNSSSYSDEGPSLSYLEKYDEDTIRFVAEVIYTNDPSLFEQLWNKKYKDIKQHIQVIDKKRHQVLAKSKEIISAEHLKQVRIEAFTIDHKIYEILLDHFYSVLEAKILQLVREYFPVSPETTCQLDPCGYPTPSFLKKFKTDTEGLKLFTKNFQKLHSTIGTHCDQTFFWTTLISEVDTEAFQKKVLDDFWYDEDSIHQAKSLVLRALCMLDPSYLGVALIDNNPATRYFAKVLNDHSKLASCGT